MVLIPNLLFQHGSSSSNESAKFEKNLQKIFAFFFESKETTPFSFNDILDCLRPLNGIPRDFKDFKVRQSSFELFSFSTIFSSK